MLTANKFFALLTGWFLLIGYFPIVHAGTIKLFNPDASNWVTLTPTIEVNSAINDSELIVLNLDGMQGHKISLKLAPSGNTAITFQWYQVLQGVNDNGAIDALQSPDNSGVITAQTNSSMLVLKASIPTSVGAGNYRWSIQVMDNGTTAYQGSIAINVYPFKLETSTVTIQGNLLFKRNDIAEDTMLALLKTMRSYDFNSVILPKQYFKSATISRVERYVLDNFKYIRISPRTLFSRTNTLAQELKAEGVSREQWLKDECNYANNLVRLMNVSNKNALVYKLWDEPLPVNYPEVIYTYTGLHNCVKNVSLELTEQPSMDLGDIADIWTINLNALTEQAVQMARKQNDRIYLYANRLHDIRANPQLIRNVGWLMGYFGLDGYHFWSVSDWGNGTLEQASSDTGNEERGTLFYWDSASKKLLSSLRMEMFHQGLADMQLIEVVKKCSLTANNKGNTKAAALLAKLATSMDQWNFANGTDPGSALIHYRTELLSIAVACNDVRMRRPLPWSTLNLH